jgi:hypothetical protein
MLVLARAVWSIAFMASEALGAPYHVLDIDNRVGKFEKFYAGFKASPTDSEARFVLWQKEGGMAAVPPGAAGDAMARKLLDDAWDKYPALVPRLGALTDVAETTARSIFARDNKLLGTDADVVHARLILYVGQFDNNAFTVPAMDGKPPTVLMPVENAILTLVLAHELAHAIHMQLAKVKNAFGAPIGETMFMEGLAMRTAQLAVPNLSDAAYTEMPTDKGWFAQCTARREAVLKGIAADLDRSGQDIAMKYTFGQGNTGMSREAYCGAWFAIGNLLERGKTLQELARIPEDRMVMTIRSAISADTEHGAPYRAPSNLK